MKKNIYKWHRILGLIVSLPVILWTLSGLLHPIMGWVKPQVAQKTYTPEVLDLNKLTVRLDSVLKANGLDRFQNIHLASFDKKSFAIIQADSSIYIDLKTGKISGEAKNAYITFLARHFSGDSLSSIVSIKEITEYSTEYKAVNRLLPVYRVEFARDDSYTVFIEPNTARLGGVLDNNRFVFNRLFEWFHNFSFLGESIFKTVVVVCLIICTIGVSIAGLYIYGFTRKSLGEKGKLGYNKRKERNWHRLIGLMFSVSLCLFAFSGAYHLLKKEDPIHRLQYQPNDFFSIDVLKNLPKEKFVTMGLVTINGRAFYQCYTKTTKGLHVEYIDVDQMRSLPNGDELYAKDLVKRYFALEDKDILSVENVTRFTGEYGFINKRLPVQKVQTNLKGSARYYIETRTGKLAADVVDSDMLEGLSFAYFHKYHMFDFLGKFLRNCIMMIFAFGHLLSICLGMWILIKKQKFI